MCEFGTGKQWFVSPERRAAATATTVDVCNENSVAINFNLTVDGGTTNTSPLPSTDQSN